MIYFFKFQKVGNIKKDTHVPIIYIIIYFVILTYYNMINCNFNCQFYRGKINNCLINN